LLSCFFVNLYLQIRFKELVGVSKSKIGETWFWLRSVQDCAAVSYILRQNAPMIAFFEPTYSVVVSDRRNPSLIPTNVVSHDIFDDDKELHCQDYDNKSPHAHQLAGSDHCYQVADLCANLIRGGALDRVFFPDTQILSSAW
jgi:hypothetical protein